MTAAALVCVSCGTELSAKAKFCSACGAAVTSAPKPAEYKQVTVLFADVVHSMDIAAAVGAERLREIMADLADRCAAVVRGYANAPVINSNPAHRTPTSARIACRHRCRPVPERLDHLLQGCEDSCKTACANLLVTRR
jgi:hypothetical protein